MGRPTHRLSRTKTYLAWRSMKARCSYDRPCDKGLYVGVTVSPEWWNSFDTFLADMGIAPPGMSLDRIDGKKGYSKNNCRWATQLQQVLNSSNPKFITFNGETLCIGHWAKRLGMSRGGMRRRLTLWSLEKAMTHPITRKGK